ncbi:MAG: hypothetical protein PHG67_14580 [Bacteroidales bacterium]|nr:hypothetical protein [Bacteroidales bacterium]
MKKENDVVVNGISFTPDFLDLLTDLQKIEEIRQLKNEVFDFLNMSGKLVMEDGTLSDGFERLNNASYKIYYFLDALEGVVFNAENSKNHA